MESTVAAHENGTPRRRVIGSSVRVVGSLRAEEAFEDDQCRRAALAVAANTASAVGENLFQVPAASVDEKEAARAKKDAIRAGGSAFIWTAAISFVLHYVDLELFASVIRTHWKPYCNPMPLDVIDSIVFGDLHYKLLSSLSETLARDEFSHQNIFAQLIFPILGKKCQLFGIVYKRVILSLWKEQYVHGEIAPFVSPDEAKYFTEDMYSVEIYRTLGWAIRDLSKKDPSFKDFIGISTTHLPDIEYAESDMWDIIAGLCWPMVEFQPVVIHIRSVLNIVERRNLAKQGNICKFMKEEMVEKAPVFVGIDPLKCKLILNKVCNANLNRFIRTENRLAQERRGAYGSQLRPMLREISGLKKNRKRKSITKF